MKQLLVVVLCWCWCCPAGGQSRPALNRCSWQRTPAPIRGFRYRLSASTSSRLDVDQLDLRQMTWSEETLTCRAQIALQVAVDQAVPYIRYLPLLEQPLLVPGSQIQLSYVRLMTIGSARVDSLLLDIDAGVSSLELTVNDLVLAANVSGPDLQLFGVDSVLPYMRLPELRVRVTLVKSVLGGPERRRTARVDDLAASVVLVDVPRVTGEGDELLQAIYEFIDGLLEGILDENLASADLEPLLILLRDVINEALQDQDVSVFQPDLLETTARALNAAAERIPARSRVVAVLRQNMFPIGDFRRYEFSREMFPPRRQFSGDGRQSSGAGRQFSGDGLQFSGDGLQFSGARRQFSGDGLQFSGAGRQRQRAFGVFAMRGRSRPAPTFPVQYYQTPLNQPANILNVQTT